MNLFKRFRKGLSLRLVNWLGLSVMFASLLVSYNYIKRELSYDRYNVNADRMVRLSLQRGDDSADVFMLGNDLDAVFQQIPEIEQVAKLGQGSNAVLMYRGEKHLIDYFRASSNFFDVFSVPWVQGEKGNGWKLANQMIVSESFAKRIFSDGPVGEIKMNGIWASGGQVEDTTIVISGVFKDIPETSHFHTDVFLYRPSDMPSNLYCTYLLLKEHTDIGALEHKLTQLIEQTEKGKDEPLKTIASLMPVTDIHLHSHEFRELAKNGNINYLYFVVGANLLLLVVVLFNLWLNASLIFSYNRRHYQLLRLNGASSHTVVKDETLLALLLGCLSIFAGTLAAWNVSSAGLFPVHITVAEAGAFCFIFLCLIMIISLLPVLKNISSTLFLNASTDLRPVKFSFTNVRYMLTAQYAMVMIIVILAFGINRQMNMVKTSQVGGNKHNVLVMSGQTDQVNARYGMLKQELLKHSEIEAVTSAFHAPGDNIWQMLGVTREDNNEKKSMAMTAVGEGFLPFLQIRTIAGQEFSPAKFDYAAEEKMMLAGFFERKRSDHVEEYIINRKALNILGYDTPEAAIGQSLRIEMPGIDYINRGIVVGVTDDFNYAGLFEESEPMIILQRLMFQNNMMVRIDPGRFNQGLELFTKVWNEVNPDYPANYTFLNDIFGKTYYYELYAERLVYIFSALCLVIANLGLIIFMAFIIKRRTKEIGIRKVNGAGFPNILLMLNMNFVRWIALGFAIAVPVAWYVMHRWLEHFAYRISLSWWIFALAGLLVMMLSLALVSLQSWRAANTNPVEAIKSE